MDSRWSRLPGPSGYRSGPAAARDPGVAPDGRKAEPEAGTHARDMQRVAVRAVLDRGADSDADVAPDHRHHQPRGLTRPGGGPGGRAVARRKGGATRGVR